MAEKVAIEGGFAEVPAGQWLMGRGQPAAFEGVAVRRRRRGWCVRDRGRLDLVETSAKAMCASAERPFLTYIPCADAVFAVSGKVLVAPAAARKSSAIVKVVPMTATSGICATEFAQDAMESAPEAVSAGATGDGGEKHAWVVLATQSRTVRITLEEGRTISVRPQALVAWTGKKPTGFCPKLGLLDILLPRGPKDLLLTFYGPSVVWVEGAAEAPGAVRPGRRPYGI